MKELKQFSEADKKLKCEAFKWKDKWEDRLDCIPPEVQNEEGLYIYKPQDIRDALISEFFHNQYNEYSQYPDEILNIEAFAKFLDEYLAKIDRIETEMPLVLRYAPEIHDFFGFNKGKVYVYLTDGRKFVLDAEGSTLLDAVELKDATEVTNTEDNKKSVSEGLKVNLNNAENNTEIIEVNNKTDQSKLEKDDDRLYQEFKVLYHDVIAMKCNQQYGKSDDEKLFEDTAKELFLQSKDYLPVNDKKSNIVLDTKTVKTESVKKVEANNAGDILSKIDSAKASFIRKGIMEEVLRTAEMNDMEVTFEDCKSIADEIYDNKGEAIFDELYTMILSMIKDIKSDKAEGTREYRYITNHGIGPGTVPNGVLVRSEELDYGKTAIYTNRPLTSEELKKYDIKPEWIQESKSNKETCIMCGTDKLNGRYSVKGKPVCDACGKKYTLDEIEAKIPEVKTESNEQLTEAIDKVANNLPKFIYDLTKSDFDKYGETAWSANEPQKTATGIIAYEVYRNGKSDYTLEDIEKAVLEHFPELRVFAHSATGKNIYFTKDDKNTKDTLQEDQYEAERRRGVPPIKRIAEQEVYDNEEWYREHINDYLDITDFVNKNIYEIASEYNLRDTKAEEACKEIYKLAISLITNK